MSMRLQLVPKMCTVKWKGRTFLLTEISDVEDAALASTIPNETNNEVDHATVLQDFQQDHLDTSVNSVVIACRKHILKSAYMALSNTYCSWHKTPNVQFVGEIADDYGGPSREFLQ
ncbi:hypothetical protein ATANTOWER_019093 [Ataeniobius toweri]|uniref:Uncharacterized protein n=1 Tax=Ataeniobius toweri TaxID=208326 RepID=A0ABU7AQX7_9TELE|nr:hypothetical protein [Ataeniobius toweri]